MRQDEIAKNIISQMVVAENIPGQPDEIPERPTITCDIPPLPKHVQHNPELASTASRWLDEYIAFSRLWSPRAHDDFHESVGLWLLSAVAARRVCLDFGKRRYTNLYIALTARTSVFSKSTTAEIAQAIMKQADLIFMMAPDDATPQAFVRGMVHKLPADWADLSELDKQRKLHRYSFAAQKAWYFDEFGQKIDSMMRQGGFMSDFRSLLRKFDDCPDLYEYETVGRGSDTVKSPYLALLVNMTPADLEPYAKKGSALWNDGFWARFAFLTPPANSPRKNGRFPDWERVIPNTLSEPLRLWHERLGVPEARLIERESNTGRKSYELVVTALREKLCVFGPGVRDAFYAYNDALLDIIAKSELTDLDGNYARLPEKALRVAMILASFENDDLIEMKHWARAQQIAEGWRTNLHNLYTQVINKAKPPEAKERLEWEDKILALIANKGPRTIREMCQGLSGMDTKTANDTVKQMVEAGYLDSFKSGRTDRYAIAKVESPDSDLKV